MKKIVRKLERKITEIAAKSNLEWDEDHITYELMRELRILFENKTIKFTDFSKIVHWQSFKFRGKRENAYGDIALIVNIQFTSGEILKGVATLEAKRDFPSGNYESLDIGQLDRIFSTLPYSHLLLYNKRALQLPLKFPNSNEYKSHFWVSPINTSRQLLPQLSLRNNNRLLRTCFPFSMFLTARIFWGLDLDYRTEIYQDVINGHDEIVNANYLGVVNIFYPGQSPIEAQLNENWVAI